MSVCYYGNKIHINMYKLCIVEKYDTENKSVCIYGCVIKVNVSQDLSEPRMPKPAR